MLENSRRSRVVTKIQAAIILGVILVAIIAASYYYNTTSTPPTAEQVLVIGTTVGTENVEPAGNGEWWDMMVGCMVGESLFEFREMAPFQWELLPLLGESYTYSPDGTFVTIKVKQGIKFTDGTPFNASVVKYCWDRALGINAPVAYFLRKVKQITVLDTSTVQIEQSTPDFTFMKNTAVYSGTIIYSPSAVQNYNVSTQTDYVGTGPFKLVSFAKGEQLILEKNKDYWGEPKPKLDKIVVRWYGDSATLRMALESGSVDMAYKDLDPRDIVAVEQKPGIIVERNTGTAFNLYLAFNFRNQSKPLNNKLVRHAISYAIDYDYIVNQVALGSGKRMLSQIPSFVGPYYKPVMANVNRNITKAKELLAQAGYADGFETGLLIAPGHTHAADRLMCTVIQDNLKDVGIDVNIIETDVATEFERVFSTGEFDISFGGWYPDFPDPDNVLYAIIASQEAGGLYVTSYKNERIDQLLLQGIATQNATEREETYDELQNVWYDDLPTLPLIWTYRQVAYRTWVKGWKQLAIVYTEVRQSFANATIVK